MAVSLSLSTWGGPRGQREQGLREVRGEVQESSRGLCEGGGEDGGLVEQREGQRRAVGQHVRGQRRGGARPHLVEGEAWLVAVERVGGRGGTQSCEKGSFLKSRFKTSQQNTENIQLHVCT